MSDRRWMKFWPQDWQRDPALRSCSLAARGLWMELICIAHEGTPYGHVTINGKAMTSRQIASVSGVPEKEAARLLNELEDAGVFSVSDSGIIFSRRMVRDDAIAQQGREAIGKRWKKETKPNTGNGSPPNTDPIRVGDSLEAEAEAERKIPATLDAKAASEPDARAELWGQGLALLRGLTGKPDGPSRTLLGRLLKTSRDDCPAVMRALLDASDLRPVDPVAWLTKAVGQPADDARLLIAAGLVPDRRDIDGESHELFPRMLQ